eukprot:630456-Amphidinium_carterae.1
MGTHHGNAADRTLLLPSSLSNRAPHALVSAQSATACHSTHLARVTTTTQDGSLSAAKHVCVVPAACAHLHVLQACASFSLLKCGDIYCVGKPTREFRPKLNGIHSISSVSALGTKRI